MSDAFQAIQLDLARLADVEQVAEPEEYIQNLPAESPSCRRRSTRW